MTKTPSFRPIKKFAQPPPNPPIKTEPPRASNAVAAKVDRDAGPGGSIKPAPAALLIDADVHVPDRGPHREMRR